MPVGNEVNFCFGPWMFGYLLLWKKAVNKNTTLEVKKNRPYVCNKICAVVSQSYANNNQSISDLIETWLAITATY